MDYTFNWTMHKSRLLMYLNVWSKILILTITLKREDCNINDKKNETYCFQCKLQRIKIRQIMVT